MSGSRPSRLLTTVMVLFTIYALLPIAYILISSTKSETELATTFGFAFSGENHLLANLSLLFTYNNGIYLTWFWNSIWYSTLSAVGATALAASAGYGLAHFRFYGRGFISQLILVGVIVPQTAIVIPIFLIMSKIGIIDTPAAVILPSIVFPLGVYLMRIHAEQAFPRELLEAARLDGASEVHIMAAIATPAMKAGITTVFLLSFVSAWNNYFLPLVVITREDRLSLTVGLANWYGTAMGGTASGVPLMSLVIVGALVGVLPIVLSFIVLHRFWVSGATAGALK